MTQRAPLHVRIPLRERSRDLLTWISSGPQLGIQPIPGIQRQSDWPLPVRARPNLELRTWVNSLPPGVIANPVPPIRNYDWPNPTLRVQSFELRTWLHSQQLTPSVVMPFGQSDWPNPRGPLRNQDLSWVDGLPQTALSLTLPPLNNDWPNPLARSANLTLRSWVSGLQLQPVVVQIPFSQFDWQNPYPKAANPDLRTWVDGLPQAALALTVPPRQLDWPNPSPARTNLELRSWTFALQQQPAVQSAFSQYDWPNPAPTRANLELRSWTFTDPAALLSVVFVTVPNVVGETQAQATTDIGAQGLITSITTDYSASVAAGLVISQDPIGGTSAGTGTIVTIVVSLGPQPVTSTDAFSGGFLHAYELEQSRRRKKRREQEELEEDAQALKDQLDREIALLLRKQEAEDERRAELDRLQRLVRDHSRNALELSDRAKIAYLRALTQANFSAMEALDRELQRQLEEEEITALMILLNED